MAINPRGLRLPSTGGLLRLAPIRSDESVALDAELSASVPYLPWGRFLDEVLTPRGETYGLQQGQHATIVGATGSGKTTLARQLLPFRRYVVVLGTKPRDDSLYRPLRRQGYDVVTDWEPDARQQPRVIFAPPLRSPAPADREAQREAFREALSDVYIMGRWALYGDEIRYLTDVLRLKTEFETLWLQGRSLGVSIYCATQRPVSIPHIAFDAEHLFFFRMTDRRDVITMAEFTGALGDLVRYTIPRLPRHELLYVNTVTDQLVRTKVST